MRILFYLNRKKVNKSGQAPIYIRITIHGQRAEFSTGIFISAKEWNPSTHRINGNDPAKNMQLQETESAIRFAKIEMERQNLPVTPALIRDAVQKQAEPEQPTSPDKPKAESITMANLFQLYLDDRRTDANRGKIDPRTLKQYAGRCSIVTKYLQIINSPNIPAEEINKKFVSTFIDYLTASGYKNNYINKIIAIIKQSLNLGLSDDLVSVDKLKNLTLHYEEKEFIAVITAKEAESLQKTTFVNPLLVKVRDLFLLQYFTGVTYCDIPKIKRDIISKEYINGTLYRLLNFTRRKTKTMSMPPLCDEAEQILEKYDYCMPRIANGTYNRILKEVAAIVGININLTTHVGRASFAQQQIKKGVSFETVATFIGQKGTETLRRHYGRVDQDRIVLELSTIERNSN